MQEIIELTKKLIKMQSVSSNLDKLDEIIDFVENYFKVMNSDWVYIEKQKINSKPSIIIKNFDWKSADIVLNWHLDVVPSSDALQFEPQIIDDKLYWRWAWDMKSWVAILMVLMKDVIEKKYKEKKISLILSADEEVWWFDGVGALVSQWYSWKIVLIPDWWADNRIVIKEKWTITLDVESIWVPGHSSRPWLCKNAFDQLFAYYSELKQYFVQNSEDEEHRHNTVELTVLNGWTVWNTIPWIANGKINIRFIAPNTWEQILNKALEISSKYDIKISHKWYWDVLDTDENNYFVKKYFEVAKKVLNWKYWILPKLVKEHWASDWRFFSWVGWAVIIHRPNCANIHWDGERVEIESVYRVFELYKEFVFSEF